MSQDNDYEPEACGFFYHTMPKADACDHDWSGEEELLDESGRVRGSTTVCSKCNMTAFDHSMRYGE
jgi:hypothetical protein